MDPLNSFVNDHRDSLIQFAKSLVSTASPNPPGDERDVVGVVLAELSRLGLDEHAEVVSKHAERPNVIVRIRGDSPGPTVMLCGHSDTKPIGDLSKWRTDPLKPTIRDGKMYGLGTTDMKGAVAASVYAVAALHHQQSRLHGDVLLVVNADEERSMEFGSGFLAGEFEIKADIAILGEPSGITGPEFEFLHVVSRGISCFRIRVHGTQMHSSLTDRLPSMNANQCMADVLLYLKHHLRLTFKPHALCPAPTINLAVRVNGGIGYGVCPGVAVFESDIRTLPGMTLKQLRDDIESCLDGYREKNPEVEIELEFESAPMDWFPPTEVPQDHAMIKAILDAAESELGFRPKLSAFPGGSDAKNFQGVAGIPTIPSFGPGWLPLAHGPNECVGVDSLASAAKIYANAIAVYLTDA